MMTKFAPVPDFKIVCTRTQMIVKGLLNQWNCYEDAVDCFMLLLWWCPYKIKKGKWLTRQFIIIYRLVALSTPVSCRWTVPLKRVSNENKRNTVLLPNFCLNSNQHIYFRFLRVNFLTPFGQKPTASLCAVHLKGQSNKTFNLWFFYHIFHWDVDLNQGV